MSRRWSSVSRAALATVGTCLLVTLVGWAALIGPSQVFRGFGPTPTDARPIPPVLLLFDQLNSEDRARGKDRSTATHIAEVIGVVVELAVLAGIVYVIFLLLRRALDAWQLRLHYDAPASADFDVLERVRRSLADDAAAQLALLLEGEPRNAIVAIWHRFEVQAEESGLPRHGWETSAEFAVRMLDVAEVDPSAVTRLLELYREARFSEHELTESHRQAAGEALRKVQSQIGPNRSTVRS